MVISQDNTFFFHFKLLILRENEKKKTVPTDRKLGYEFFPTFFVTSLISYSNNSFHHHGQKVNIWLTHHPAMKSHKIIFLYYFIHSNLCTETEYIESNSIKV
jgi:hypothetical protein